MRLPVALTIAGSDSGGGAGIQADLKTFAALGCHGTSAIAAVTAQNTRGVTRFVELAPDMVREQIDLVVDDLAPAAVKTGMLASPAIIRAVATAVREHELRRLVVDPVMIAKGGHRLLRDDAIDAMREELLPLAAVLTPNIPEAEVLLDRGIEGRDARAEAARDLVAMGCASAVVKGGHAGADAESEDAFYDGATLIWLPAPRIATPHTHGSGCTFSAAIAAGLARGLPVAAAVAEAKTFITGAIRNALEIGGGHGPVNPMWQWASGSRPASGTAHAASDPGRP